ncbi:MAG: hypothetical protein Hyperionvirus2_117 [Hyperionvirus sp.]|uniref:Uncharacterized protein n=1 Tax=Hyperionvirus sp. TaxID=2487770 RepID=A0A3G5ABS7_9VIRU|nr:MAG: hypothetical protein Hyperionvirus2_117 [Hyperionvirus sp.]
MAYKRSYDIFLMGFALASVFITIPNVIYDLIPYGCNMVGYFNIAGNSVQFLIEGFIARSFFVVLDKPMAPLNFNGLIATVLFLTCYFVSFVLAAYSGIRDLCFFEVDSPVSIYMFGTLIVSFFVVSYYCFKIYGVIRDKKWFEDQYFKKIQRQLISLVVPIVLGWMLIVAMYLIFNELLFLLNILLNSVLIPIISKYNDHRRKNKIIHLAPAKIFIQPAAIVVHQHYSLDSPESPNKIPSGPKSPNSQDFLQVPSSARSPRSN